MVVRLLLSVWIVGPVASASPDRGVAVDPVARAAKDVRHMGEHCSYATSAMIGQVLDRGVPWTFAGEMLPVDRLGEAAFATPYRVVDGAGVEVSLLGNELLDGAVRVGPAVPVPVSLEGRMLESRGRRYAVVTRVSHR